MLYQTKANRSRSKLYIGDILSTVSECRDFHPATIELLIQQLSSCLVNLLPDLLVDGVLVHPPLPDRVGVFEIFGVFHDVLLENIDVSIERTSGQDLPEVGMRPDDSPNCTTMRLKSSKLFSYAG